MFSDLQKANFYLNWFAFSKVPLIWSCRPKLLALDNNAVEIKIPLKHKTKNHLNSMYFGALAIGADLAGGFLAMHKAKLRSKPVSLAFKAVDAQFLKRPEADVHFHCRDGNIIDEMLEETIATGQRVNQAVTIIATCPSLNGDEPMAEFTLTLSLKCRS